jgi:hypothetical protein
MINKEVVTMSVKIIQILAMPNNEYYQGMTIGLGDDGVVYSASANGWEVYIPLEFKLNQGDSK